MRPAPLRRALRRAAQGLAGTLFTLSSAAALAQACPPNPEMPSPEAVQAAAAQAQDRGFLWRLHKDGRSAWLFGSLHLGALDWALPGPQTRAALQAADSLALELDLTDPSVATRMQPRPDQALALPEALRSRLAQQAQRQCLPPEALATLHPVMQAVTLSLLQARWDGMHAAYGQELVLSGMARALGKPVLALETPELQRDALLDHPPARSLQLIQQMLDELDNGKTRRVFARLVDAWQQGDLATLGRYGEWCECQDTPEDRDFMARLNDGRNPHLADRIAALHAEGRAVFAAVGALHMTGPQALPALLAARGFTVERLH